MVAKSGNSRRGRWEVRCGSPVQCQDGECGMVEALVVGSDARELTGLVIHRGFLRHHDRVVPIEAVESADEELVRLRLSMAELATLPAPSASGPPGKITLRRPLVGCTDGSAGAVKLFFIGPATHQITHIVVQRPGLGARPRIAPVHWVVEVDSQRIRLNATRQQLAERPDYRADEEIQSSIEAALHADAVLRATDLGAHRTEVGDGIVTLEGHVSSRFRSRRAEEIALGVSGVLAVRNLLVPDDDLATEVAQALARDSRTKTPPISVAAYQGFIYLRGHRISPAARLAAEEIAASVPSVRGVVNQLGTAGVSAPADPPLLPPIGIPVFGTDGEQGRLEAVVIDPRLRRVTHLMVAARFKPEQGGGLRTRRLPIPVGHVERITSALVLLRFDLAQAAALPDYAINRLVAPDPAWQPPFPYKNADVRWSKKLIETTRSSTGEGEGDAPEEAPAA